MMTRMTRMPPRTLMRLTERPVYWKPVGSMSSPTVLSPANGQGLKDIKRKTFHPRYKSIKGSLRWGRGPVM
jgi:hypothetical protein